MMYLVRRRGNNRKLLFIQLSLTLLHWRLVCSFSPTTHPHVSSSTFNQVTDLKVRWSSLATTAAVAKADSVTSIDHYTQDQYYSRKKSTVSPLVFCFLQEHSQERIRTTSYCTDDNNNDSCTRSLLLLSQNGSFIRRQQQLGRGAIRMLLTIFTFVRSLYDSSTTRSTTTAAAYQEQCRILRKNFWQEKPHKKLVQSIRKRILRFGVALIIAASTLSTVTTSIFPSAMVCWATPTSGGRMGGSFKSSSTVSSPSRGSTTHYRGRTSSSSLNRYRSQPSSPSSSSWYFQRLPSSNSVGTKQQQINPWITIHHYHSSSWWPQCYERPGGSSSSSGVLLTKRRCSSNSEFKPVDIALLIGTGALFIHGFKNNYHRQQQQYDGGVDEVIGPLGSGATSASITVSLDILDRNDPQSLLNKLDKWARQYDTSQRHQVQKLISNVALELLRQEASIVSAQTTSRHFTSSIQAQRDYNIQSVRNRSKFDYERIHSYGGEMNHINENNQFEEEGSNSPQPTTKAVVTISFAMEGNSTRLRTIRNRQDLIDTLSLVAADVITEDCLLSGEVLWTPDNPTEQMQPDDVYAFYPGLIPI